MELTQTMKSSVEKSKVLSVEPCDFDIIRKLINRETHLSYSKLKHLTSPINFFNNITKPKSGNPSMSFGSLVDTLITEEHNFNNKYYISDISVSSDNQKALIEKTLNADKSISIIERFKNAFAEIYKRGKVDDYAHLLQYCAVIEKGIICVSQKEFDEAVIVAENLKNQPEIEDLLAQNEGMQLELNFEYRGWKFKSYLDMFSIGNFYDFKFASQLNPDTFSRDIDKLGYDIQCAIYRKGLMICGLGNEKTTGNFIVYDKDRNYSIMQFGEDYQNYAERKLDVYIDRLERIIEENAWYKSYDYFEPKRVIRKPAYIKGFAE